ncbi:hypothetical protein [Pseudoduganella lutea]|uniref:SH3 domain-containing protein n=1 Tax=Pseudoduganella lutea TaxID=321985 RepID=A0A4P6L3T3_9BURK|nr:hypothetical protein [Pseudoduganella lutea]QBE65945.1 hypothetical protein EWM63_25605 [Pseudoduganella lutea]
MMSNWPKNTKNSRVNKLRQFSLSAIIMATAFASSCTAAPNVISASSPFSENPFIAVGVNPTTKVVTGYFSALLTSPGKTDECKFAFHGKMASDGKVRVTVRDAVPANIGEKNTVQNDFAVLISTKGSIGIELPVSMAPGDCDWVLESVGAPRITNSGNRYIMSVDTGPAGDWIGVITVRSKRAFFHNSPNDSTVRKAFLVAGDVAYVTEERNGWYHVKYTHGKKETAGWMKVSDTIQF